VRERKKCGSALKFGVIAAGEADFYPRFGTTMEWDTAAGQAILESAGGRVETLAGTRLTYGKPRPQKRWLPRLGPPDVIPRRKTPPASLLSAPSPAVRERGYLRCV
jgi:3'-phosphoadenosine 5'-phosphosulfate (PAPS) 3'-phosphatase